MQGFKKLVLISRAGWVERDGVRYFQDNDGYYIDKLAPLFEEVLVWSRPMEGPHAPRYSYQFQNKNIQINNVMRGVSFKELGQLAGETKEAFKHLRDADVVYAFVNTVRGSVYSIVASWFFDCVVATYNGIEWQKAQRFANAPFLKRCITGVLESLSMRSAGVRIVTGPLLKKQFDSFGPTHMVAPVSRLLALESTPERKLLADKTAHFVCPVHLHKRKCVDTLIRACHLAKARGMDLRFHIIGDGPEREGLERLTEELDLSNEVIFYGYIAEPDKMAEILRQVDAVLFAGLIEGFPRTIWEAIHFGLYVITVPVADIGSLFNSDEVALVENNAAEDFADAMEAAVRDPERTNRCASSAKQKLGKIFPQTLAEQFNGCVRECLDA